MPVLLGEKTIVCFWYSDESFEVGKCCIASICWNTHTHTHMTKYHCTLNTQSCTVFISNTKTWELLMKEEAWCISWPITNANFWNSTHWLICVFWLSVWCFINKSFRLAGNETKMNHERNEKEMWTGNVRWANALQYYAWTLWSLLVPNLIVPYGTIRTRLDSKDGS